MIQHPVQSILYIRFTFVKMIQQPLQSVSYNRFTFVMANAFSVPRAITISEGRIHPD